MLGFQSYTSLIADPNQDLVKLISRKNIPVMNQPQRKHVIRDWAGWGCGGLSCEFESPCRIRVITPIRYLNTENAPVNN